MSETLNTVILGIVEGITEFLPISSTGHLLIAEQFLGARSDLFNVAIQAGAILAIVLIYQRRLTELLLHTRQPQNRDYLIKLTVSVLITLVLGFVATQLGFKLPVTVFPIAIATLVGGVRDSRHRAVCRGQAEVGQPDLVGGHLGGHWPDSRRPAARDLPVGRDDLCRDAGRDDVAARCHGVRVHCRDPVMFAATAYLLLKARHDIGTENWSALGLGFVVSGVVAFVVVKWLLRYVQSHRFTVFAWYRIVLGVVLLAMLHQGIVH